MTVLVRDSDMLASEWWNAHVGRWVTDDDGTALVVGERDVAIAAPGAPDHDAACDECGAVIKRVRAAVATLAAGSVVRHPHAPGALPWEVGEPQRWCAVCASKT